MADRPRVSLGVTAYNNERYLPAALDAALAQDFRDFEVVICDNQSTDATWDICRTYAERDGRFRVFRNPVNLGVAGNFRRVLDHARGEFFRWTAHDDLMAPSLLRRCVAALDANPRAVLAYPRGIVIDDNGTELFACHGEPAIHHRTAIRRVAAAMPAFEYYNAQFALIRADVLRHTRLIGPFAVSDHRLLTELAARGEWELVPEWLFYRRAHRQSSFGGDRDVRQRYEWLEPEVARWRRFRTRSGGEIPRVTLETAKALLGARDLALATRLATTCGYCIAWPTRVTRIQLGRWRRRRIPRGVRWSPGARSVAGGSVGAGPRTGE